VVDRTPRELTARGFLLYWLPVLVWAGLIFWLSSMSATPEPAAIHGFPGWSLGAHFTLYLVLGALLFRALVTSVILESGPMQQAARTDGTLDRAFAKPIAAKRILLPMVIGALYAASDELHQYFVPARQADLFDLMIDVAGLAFGILLVWYFFAKRVGFRA
jgi:hypothetical protein